MSKWLRRGFGQNNNTLAQQDERQPNTEFPTPPRNDMPSAGAPVYQSSQQSPMVGGAFDSNAMDVDSASASRNKYSTPPPPSNYKQYDSSPSRRAITDDHRSQTSRTSRSDRRSGSRSAYQPRASTATTAGNTTHLTPTGHFGAPQTYHKETVSTPTPDVQPSFPPPAVTADSPQPSEASQRRPAYLLHRDLVIGKGSYGQVCIASRGEPEGHNSGRSGKRKKFACKCVMLRNDPKYIAKLQEEVNVLRELRGHENVIRLYDVFCVDNELFIITELGRGGDLFHLLTTHPKHGVTEAYAGTFGRTCDDATRAPTIIAHLLVSLFTQPKPCRRCFRPWRFCTRAAFAIAISNSRTGYSNQARMCGVR